MVKESEEKFEVGYSGISISKIPGGNRLRRVPEFTSGLQNP
jgi:hypothetical protein